MFNRQPFNRGKFNVGITSTMSNSGIGQIKLKTTDVKVYKIISANSISNMSLKGSLEGTKVYRVEATPSNMTMTAKSEGTKVYIVIADNANMFMTSQADQILAGEKIIKLEKALMPGDELIINTCDMTITLNGTNAADYFSDESNFFDLLKGINILIYSDSESNRDISFDIIWKDKWL